VSADAIYTEDLSGTVTSWNAAAERLYGLSAAEMVGQPAGRLVPVSLTVSPLRSADGAVTGVAASVQDITERTRLMADLENAQRELQDQQQVLLRSTRDLEQFAYVASHDLSEPLRVVTGYVQLLERRYAGALDDRGERYVQHVVEGCQRMRDLIDDLLD
jgi:signal transduction histidine kinase